MIETKISSSDGPNVKEFTPPRFKNRDRQLRVLVQLVSFLTIALFLSSTLRIPGYDEIFDLISLMLFVGLLLLFLTGIGLSFFQLRYINDRRNKITNLGGVIGLFGLLLTGIPCACEIALVGLEGLEPFLSSLLGFGLFLTFFGFFAEATLLDETLLYVIRVNFRAIIRYSLTIIGAFLVNLGVLVILAPRLNWRIALWPQGLAGEWVTVLGVLIMWGAWFQHINRLIWNNRILLLRTSYLTFSQVLVVFMVVIPLLSQPLTPETFLFVSLPMGIAGIAIIYGDYLKFGVPEQIRGFIKKYMFVIQGIVLVCASALIMIGAVYQNFEEPVNTLFVISFRGFYSGVGLLLIYRMWFRIINNFITQSILFLRTYYKQIVTLGAVIPMILGAVELSITEGDHLVAYLIPVLVILAGYLISVIVWYFPKHSYSRGVNTSLSSFLFFWSLLVILNNINLGIYDWNFPTNLGLLIPGALLVFYLGVDTYLWRKELYYVLQQVWAFIRTYYREFVTIFGLGFMIVGSLFPEFFAFLEVMDPFYPIPVFSFIFGYSLIMIIWRFPKQPIYFRGITTAVSMIVSLWGVISITFSRSFSFDFFGESPLDLWPSIVSTFYLGVGIVISVYLWRTEIKRSVIQVGQVIVNAIKGTIEFFVNVVKAVWNAFKQAFWGVIQYIRGNYRQIVTVFSLITMFMGLAGSNEAFNWDPLAMFFLGYLVSCSVWRFPTRHEYFRGITTTLSIFTLFWGTGLLLKNGISAPDLFAVPFLITYLLIVVASVVPIFLWLEELSQLVKQIAQAIKQAFMRAIYAVINFVKTVWNAFKQAFWAVIEFVRINYKEIISVFSLITMFLGFVGSNDAFKWESIALFFLGYLVSCSVWRFPTRHEYFRGISTTVSIFTLFWGMAQLLKNGISAPDLLAIPFLVTYLLIVVASGLPIYLWRVELWRVVKQIAQAIKQAFMIAIYAVINFVKSVWNAFKQAFWAVIDFVRMNYKEFISVFSLFTMLLGLVGSNDAFNWELLALFFLGYLVSCSVWRFPTRHEYFRGIATTLSIFTLFWGVLLLSKNGISAPDLFAVPFLITYFFIVVGSVLPVYLWRVELWRVVKQIAEATKQVFMIVIYTVINFVKAAWNAAKQAFLAILHSVHGLLLRIQRNISRLIQYVKENVWNLVQYLFTIIGVLMINIGLFMLIVPPTEQMGILWVFFGVLVICGAWWENTLLVLRAIAHSLMELASSLKNFFLQTSMFLWIKFLTLIEFGREHFKAIAKTVTTLVGVFLVLLGLLGSFGFTIAFLDNTEVPPELFLIIGAGLLITTWFSQVLEFLKYTVRSIRDALDVFGHYIWDLGVSIKDAVVKFFIYIISLWREIVRATATVVGVLLVIIGFFNLSVSNGNDFINIGLILVGIVMIFWSWRSQIKEFLIRIGHSIQDALSAFGHYIWNIGVSIKDTVVRFFTYIISLWREIVRATATVVGVLLVIIGFSYFQYAPSDEGKQLSMILIIIGVAMMAISWRSQLGELLIRTVVSIRDALGAFGHYIWDIGVAVKDAVGKFFTYIISLWREIVRVTAT
ncbi:MAG: hypothetical protein ACXAAT_09300, partial [Candidatus Hodarchaeales archaeon]